MACNCGNTPCTGTPACSCPVKDLSTDCALYTGVDLPCSGITSNTIMTDVIIALDAFICNKFNEVLNYLTLINIGGGAKVYKGISGIGNKEIRTITSADTTLLDVIEDTDTINIQAGNHRLQFIGGTDTLSLIVNTIGGDTTLTDIDLSKYNYDTFVQTATFDSLTEILTITRNNGEADITVDLSYFDNHVESGVYTPASNIITLTLTDLTTVDINVATLVTEILAAQVQADYLEASTASKAYIANKNPSKTVVLGVAGSYTVVTGDNNYIIEIDNGANAVTIDLGTIVVTTEFFVGFVQKGTGLVTFTGYTILPSGLGDKIVGQGHVAAMEVINSTKYLHGTLKA